MINFRPCTARADLPALTGSGATRSACPSDRAQHRGSVQRRHRQHRCPAPVRVTRASGHRSGHHDPCLLNPATVPTIFVPDTCFLFAPGPVGVQRRADRARRSRRFGRAQPAGSLRVRNATAPWTPASYRNRAAAGLTFGTGLTCGVTLRTNSCFTGDEARVPTRVGDFHHRPSTMTRIRRSTGAVFGDTAGRPTFWFDHAKG